MDKLELRRQEMEKLAVKLRNANLNDCTDAFLGIVKDKQADTIFYDYESEAEIGMRIYAELMDYYSDDKGFILSDDYNESGVISQTQGASTLDILIGRFNVISQLNRDDAIALISLYEKTIRNVLNAVSSTDGGYIFNAAPHNLAIFDKDYAYVDTVTWVTSAFLGAVSLNSSVFSYLDAEDETVGVSFTDNEIEKMLKTISFCVRYMTEIYIDNSDSQQDRLSKGWNFTKDCSEPSLYFSYAVSECYLDIYNTFQKVIDRHNIEKKINKVKNDPSKTISTDEDIWLYISLDDRARYEAVNVELDSYKLEAKYFDIVNSTKDCFYKLEQQVKESANNVWSLVKVGLDSNFYNYNLSSVISTQTIESSSSSDALFNTIFIINNVISGGLDEDIMDKLANAVDDEEMNYYQSEYDSLLETLQAALQRTIRYNKMLVNKRKEYIVNDYFISCSESYEGEVSRKAQELRKRRIKTFTISPLLVKTNNLISEYLTKYPQVEMIKYLDELMMKKRTTVEAPSEDGSVKQYYIWCWENGEYSVASNYYYILSLASFYDYAELYENRFNRIDHENASIKESIIAQHDMESRNNGEIFSLTTERDRLTQENVQLNQRIQELESKESLVEAALRGFMHEELKANMLPLLTGLFREMNDGVIRDIKNDNRDIDHQDEIAFLNELKRTYAVSFYEEINKRVNLINDEGNNAASKIVSFYTKNMDNKANDVIKEIVEHPDFDD